MKYTVILYILLGIGVGISLPMAVDVVCDSEWSLFGGNCYKVFNQMLTQPSASGVCQRQRAHLVSIHSWMENSFVNSLLNSADPLNSKHFWIGLKLSRPNKNYVSDCQYTDGTAVEDCPFYSNTRGLYPWARYSGYPPEPNNWAEQEECIVIGHNWGVTQVLQKGWVDWRCDLEAGFVCKKKAEKIVEWEVITKEPIIEEPFIYGGIFGRLFYFIFG